MFTPAPLFAPSSAGYEHFVTDHRTRERHMSRVIHFGYHMNHVPDLWERELTETTFYVNVLGHRVKVTCDGDSFIAWGETVELDGSRLLDNTMHLVVHMPDETLTAEHIIRLTPQMLEAVQRRYVDPFLWRWSDFAVVTDAEDWSTDVHPVLAVDIYHQVLPPAAS